MNTPNIRQSLYQCLENTFTIADSSEYIFLCEATGKNHCITIYLELDNAVSKTTREPDFMSFTLSNGDHCTMQYADIKNPSSGKKQEYTVYCAKSETTPHKYRYYLKRFIKVDSSATIRKEIKYGNFSDLLSSNKLDTDETIIPENGILTFSNDYNNISNGRYIISGDKISFHNLVGKKVDNAPSAITVDNINAEKLNIKSFELSQPITFWGQSFNGTSNVTGDMTIGGNILDTGNIKPKVNGSSDIGSTNLKYKNLYLSNSISLGEKSINGIIKAGETNINNPDTIIASQGYVDNIINGITNNGVTVDIAKKLQSGENKENYFTFAFTYMDNTLSNAEIKSFANKKHDLVYKWILPTDKDNENFPKTSLISKTQLDSVNTELDKKIDDSVNTINASLSNKVETKIYNQTAEKVNQHDQAIARANENIKAINDNYLKTITFDEATSKFTFTLNNNGVYATKDVDLNLASVINSFSYDANTQELVLKDAEWKEELSPEEKAKHETRVKVSALIDTYTGTNGTSIKVDVAENAISAEINAGSIDSTKLAKTVKDNISKGVGALTRVAAVEGQVSALNNLGITSDKVSKWDGEVGAKAIADANKLAIDNEVTGLAATKKIADAEKGALTKATTNAADIVTLKSADTKHTQDIAANAKAIEGKEDVGKAQELINGLTGVVTGTVDSTITALAQTNGKVTATVSKIAITQDQVTDLVNSLKGKASTDHNHDGVYAKLNDENNTGSLKISGTMTANSFYASSDIRLKKNIVPYKCDKSILDLEVKEFDYKNTDEHTIGCIAQDLQKICPQIVHESEDGYLRINESKIVYLLLDEVKQMQNKIDSLESRLTQLEKLIK